MLDFHDKVVFITGAGSGIGASTADLFLARGARVISTDTCFNAIDPEQIDFGSNPVMTGLDVTDAGAVETLINRTVETCRRLDVVVNAAGTLNIKPLMELTEQDWDRTLAVNLKGTFFVCRAALGHMMKQKNGAIVTIASISGKVGGVLASADYSASKAAVICLTKSLAATGTPYGIRVNSVAPSATKSPMLDLFYKDYTDEMTIAKSSHPMKRFGELIEVANAVLFLASDEASYINGVCLDVNGGVLMD